MEETDEEPPPYYGHGNGRDDVVLGQEMDGYGRDWLNTTAAHCGRGNGRDDEVLDQDTRWAWSMEETGDELSMNYSNGKGRDGVVLSQETG